MGERSLLTMHQDYFLLTGGLERALYRIARKHAGKLWRLALLAGAGVPVVLLVLLAVTVSQAGVGAALIAAIALIAYLGGLLVERWLFFAEARHAVMNYYGG